MWNGVDLSKFVFQESWPMTNDFCGIQTHEGELRSARAPMIDSISSTMFFSCDNFTKTSEITLGWLEMTVRGRKLQLSVEEIAMLCPAVWVMCSTCIGGVWHTVLWYGSTCLCSGGRFKNTFELLNLGALKIFSSKQTIYLSMYG